MGLMAVRTFLCLGMGMEAAPIAIKGVGMTRAAELLIGCPEKARRVRGMGTMARHTGTITGQHVRVGSKHLLSDPGVTTQT